MSMVRLRRLESDYEAVRRLARLHPRVRIEGVSGKPPDRYVLELRVRSLRQQAGEIVPVEAHRLEIRLPQGYPRDPPACRMLTPVFHPNIAPHAICIGDHWSAAEALDLLIQRVGEMLAFQCYNVKSPLNGLAAQWVQEHLDRLPVDPQEFFVDLADLDDAAGTDAETGARCANCDGGPVIETCACGHGLCADCVVHCPACGDLLCMACGPSHCPRCSGPFCNNCGKPAASGTSCAAGHRLCVDCRLFCSRCGAALCRSCGQPPCPHCAGK